MDSKLGGKETILLISVFVIATCGLIYELVAGALASYLLGDSVRQFSFIIGVYLSAMGVGSYLARFIENRLIDTFITIELLVGLVGGLSAVILFLVFEQSLAFQFILYFIVFIIGLLVGTELPLMMNILKERITFNNLVSNVFSFDYIGALLASVLFPIVLVPYLGLIRTSLLFGLLNAGVALLLCHYLADQIEHIRLLRFQAWVTILILGVAMIFAPQMLGYTESKLFDENIVFSKSSTYQRLVITRQRNELKLYINNNLQFSTRDEYRYHEALVHPLISKAPKVENVLILGGGDGLAAREILKYSEVKHITLVDLDPMMTELFAKNPILTRINANALNDSRIEIINADAFVWLRDYADQPFDAVLVDFPDPSNYSLGKLYTTTFYEALSKAMRHDGNAVIQCSSPFVGPKSFWCTNETLLQVFPETFPYHVNVPSFGEWGFILVSKNTLPIQRTERMVAPLKFYDYNLIPWLHFEKDMGYRKTEVNRLDNQILVRYFSEEWGQQ